MVKLRLRRKGRTHLPVYDIVAMDVRKKRDGAYLDRLGFYDPHHQPSVVKIDADKALYWLNVGAQPTPMVNNLMSIEGILLRKHLLIKGKSEQEIAEQVENHKKHAYDRYFKQKEKRKQRQLAKEEAEKAAKEEQS